MTKHIRKVHNVEEKKKKFSEYFTVEKLDMQGRKNEDIKRNMAFCHDINGFVDAVCEEKQIDKNEYDKVIETDDGKDSLKQVLIFTKLQQQNVGTDDINVDNEDDNEED